MTCGSKGALASPHVLPRSQAPLYRSNAVVVAAASGHHAPTTATPAAASLRRRALLGSLAAAAAAALAPAHATQLKSLHSAAPSTVTFENELSSVVKLYWVNYDGDEEFYAAVPPGGWWACDTYEGHPWRVKDSASGALLREWVATRGESVVRIGPLAPSSGSGTGTGLLEPPAAAAGSGGRRSGAAAAEAPPEFVGFDGLGGSQEEYSKATVAELALDHLGGVATLAVEGCPLPVAIPVGTSEAAQLFHASGVEFRRPSTTLTWYRTLQAAGAQVERVMITRLVGSTIYARIILSLPDGSCRSLDARPSDSLALAMQASAPLFISRRLAFAAQPDAPEQVVSDWGGHRVPVPRSGGGPLPGSGQARHNDHVRSA